MTVKSIISYVMNELNLTQYYTYNNDGLISVAD